MKILIIATGLPFPADHGRRLRMNHLYIPLANRHEIHWLCNFEDAPDDSFEESKNIFKKVYRIKTTHPEGIIQKIYQSYFPYPKKKEIGNAIEKVIADEGFDFIIIDSESMASYIENCITDVPKLLNTHNIPSLLEIRSSKVKNNLFLKVLYFLRYLYVRTYENKYFSKFSAVSFVSNKEVESFKKRNDKLRLFCIPNGVDLEKINQAKSFNSEEVGKILVFIGPMSYEPNLDAMNYFCKQIFPKIIKEDNQISLRIMGKGSEVFGKKIYPELPIIGFGFVDNPFQNLISSKLLIAPFRNGSGTRIKILEYLALGKPVVATSIGAEGIDIGESGGLFRADSPNEFADKVIKIINCPKEDYLKLCIDGQKYVRHTYDWKKSSIELENIILSMRK